MAQYFPSGPIQEMFLTSNLKKSAKCLLAVKYYDTVTWCVWAIKPYVNRVKFLLPQDYELQLMTYKAFVESQQKSPGKRRRMLSSSDAITQEVKGGEGHKPLSSLKEDSFVRGLAVWLRAHLSVKHVTWGKLPHIFNYFCLLSGR